MAHSAFVSTMIHSEQDANAMGVTGQGQMESPGCSEVALRGGGQRWAEELSKTLNQGDSVSNGKKIELKFHQPKLSSEIEPSPWSHDHFFLMWVLLLHSSASSRIIQRMKVFISA